MPILINLDRLEVDLILDEGVRNKPYTDTVGKLTIGVGRNLTDVGISDDEVKYLLKADIERVIQDIELHLPWVSEHPECVQRAVANLTFNLGINGLLKFVNSLKLLRSKYYNEAADAFLQSKWARQVKGRAQRVTDLIRQAA